MNGIVTALKTRCKDCFGKDCTVSDCPIYKLFHSKRDLDKVLILKKYCKQCLNGYEFEVCCSESCAIYKYRKENNL